jgi:hypothetical protein
MQKIRIYPYIGVELYQRLTGALRARPGLAQSDLVAEALKRYLSPDDAVHREAMVVRHLAREARALERLERDVAILSEAFGMLVRLYLTHTPSIPAAERLAAKREGGRRYRAFLEALAGRVAEGHSLFAELPGEVRLSEDDFAATGAGGSDE